MNITMQNAMLNESETAVCLRPNLHLKAEKKKKMNGALNDIWINYCNEN